MDGKKHQHVEQIQSAYRRIDDKWLHMQYRLMLVLAVMTTVTETVMFLVLQTLDFVEIPPEKYLIKYLAVPAADNLILSILATVLMRGRFSARKKIYGISLLMTLMAFSMYTIHAVWVSLMLAFAIPMLMTVVYADQRLTAMVSGLCIVERLSQICCFAGTQREAACWNRKTPFWTLFYRCCCWGCFMGSAHVLSAWSRKKTMSALIWNASASATTWRPLPMR